MKLNRLIAGLGVLALAACADDRANNDGAGEGGASEEVMEDLTEEEPASDDGDSDGGTQTDPAADDPGAGDTPAGAGLPGDWHFPPGALLPGSNTEHGSTGFTDPSVVVPEMVFPLEDGPAFLNSQILMPGGGGYWGGEWPSPGGAENDPRNFEYAWRDNFCETRKEAKHAIDLCPGGRAHKGQDIRPRTCANAVHWAVAPEDGYISHVGSISINVRGEESGMLYKFLHVQDPLPAGIEKFAPVSKGQRIARISDRLSSSSRATTVHLHFEIHGAAEIDGAIYNGALPPYTSLVESYLDFAAENPDRLAPVPPPAMSDCASPQWP